jgi:hypothetical protein
MGHEHVHDATPGASARPAPFTPESVQRAGHGQMALVQSFLGPHPAPDRASDGLAEPQAFHVEMGAECTLDVHFHELEQFQVMVSGVGRLGRHTVRAGAVHYTDAHTPYGPIVADDPGLGYLTLRRDADTRTLFMPASRERLGQARAERPASRHRNIEFDPSSCPNDGPCWHLDEPDGLRIGHASVGANDTVHFDGVESQDAYLVLTRGIAMTTVGDHREWLPLVTYVPAERGPVTIIAGEDGVDALVLVFGAERTRFIA